jgi:hypothetical protein
MICNIAKTFPPSESEEELKPNKMLSIRFTILFYIPISWNNIAAPASILQFCKW